MDGEFKHEALICTSDLNDSNKWPGLYREYTEDHYPHVYISDLTKIHLKGLSELYSWIFSNFTQLNKSKYEDSLKVKERILKSR